MAIRTDISFDWESSPRRITVDAPSTEFTMQDIQDTLRHNEALLVNCDNPQIVEGSGKVVLDTEGNAVGLTVQLINATIGFEARLGPTWVECSLSGGNLSGLEADKETVTVQVTHNNPYVNINKTSSVSATISESAISDSLDYAGILFYDENSTHSGQSHPVGTSSYPINNIEDGIALSIKYGLREMYCNSNVNIDRDITGFSVYGIIPKLILYTHGFRMDRCKFKEIILNGDFNNSLIKVNGCQIAEALNVYGAIDNSYLAGRIKIAADQNLNLDNSQSGIPGLDSPEIDMNAGEDTTLGLRAYSGGLTITNCDTPACVATLGFTDGGKPHLEPSCTDGLLSVRGLGHMDNRANGTEVDDSAFLDPIDIATLKMVTQNKVTKVGNIITIYEDDGTTPWKQYDLTDGQRIEV